MNVTQISSAGRPTRRTTSLVALASGALLLPSLLAGCTPADGSAPAETTSADTTSASAKLGECLRDAGYDVDDPDLSQGVVIAAPEGADPEEYAEAYKGCRATLPESQGGGDQGPSDQQVAEWQTSQLKVAECVREKGFEDFPDPVDGDFPGEMWSTSGSDPRQDAFFACSAEFGPNATGAGR